MTSKIFVPIDLGNGLSPAENQAIRWMKVYHQL